MLSRVSLRRLATPILYNSRSLKTWPVGTKLGPGETPKWEVARELVYDDRLVSLARPLSVESPAASLFKIHTERWRDSDLLAPTDEPYSCARTSILRHVAQGVLPPKLRSLRADTSPFVQSTDPPHPGREHIVRMVDCFVSRDDHGNRRRTIVEEVLGPSLLTLRTSSTPAVLEPAVVKAATKQVLLGLDYLHRECGALHLGLGSDSVRIALPTAEEALETNTALKPAVPDPAALKVKLFDFKISEYMDQGPCYRLWGPHIDEDAFWSTTAPEETDANMRYLDPTYKHPEALDVWSVGCLVFELLTGDSLFADDLLVDRDSANAPLFRKMLSVTSSTGFPTPPPGASEKFVRWMKAEGLLDRKPQKGKGESLQEILASYECIPKEEIEGAAKFIVRCLQVDPSKRATVQELLRDPWLET